MSNANPFGDPNFGAPDYTPPPTENPFSDPNFGKEPEQDGAFMRGLKTAGQSMKMTGQLTAGDAAGGPSQFLRQLRLLKAVDDYVRTGQG